MDFLADLRSQILATLPHKPVSRPALDQMTTPEMLVTYLNWRSRFIRSQPRRVHRSNALIANPEYRAHVADLTVLESKIAVGQDLTPHLSTRVEHGYVHAPSKKGFALRQDLDLMLNDWNVHHLHISSKIGPTGFVARNGPVLFAVFQPDDAYLIDIFPHGAWTKDAVFELIIDEWPNVGIVRKLHGVSGLDGQISEADRAKLRANGVATPFVERNGKYFADGLGATTAGTASSTTMRANKVLRYIRILSDDLSMNSDKFRQCMVDAGITPPNALDLHLVLLGDDSIAIEERSTASRVRALGVPPGI
jgi:hypothetical protein